MTSYRIPYMHRTRFILFSQKCFTNFKLRSRVHKIHKCANFHEFLQYVDSVVSQVRFYMYMFDQIITVGSVQYELVQIGPIKSIILWSDIIDCCISFILHVSKQLGVHRETPSMQLFGPNPVLYNCTCSIFTVNSTPLWIFCHNRFWNGLVY